MKKFLSALFLLLASPAFAGVSCTLPFQLQNNQLADASQVMANYNAIITCLQNAAAAGANTDITSLNGLTTPLAAAFGGSTTFIATAQSTGTANAQVIAATTPANFAQVEGYKVIFNAGFTNTTYMTLQVGSTPALTVVRNPDPGTTGGAVAGGDVVVGGTYEIVYDAISGFYVLINPHSPLPVGTVIDTVASVADPGFLLLQGQCIGQTPFFSLYQKMGTPGVGGCGAGNFPLPDGRGRVVAMIDSGGSGRITVPGSGVDGTILGNAGGQQNKALITANLPPYTPAGTIGGSQSVSGYLQVTGAANIQTGASAGLNPVTFTINGSSFTFTGTAQGGTSTPFVTLQPTLLLNKQIKY
jgi:microcystin-dependent protein